VLLAAALAPPLPALRGALGLAAAPLLAVCSSSVMVLLFERVIEAPEEEAAEEAAEEEGVPATGGAAVD
jgi:hypothetical protein